MDSKKGWLLDKKKSLEVTIDSYRNASPVAGKPQNINQL